MNEQATPDSTKETPLFTKTYDFLLWVVPLTDSFPRMQRHTVTKRLLDAALNFLERLVDANSRRGRQRLNYLVEADAELDKIRFYLRLAHRWQWMNDSKYQHASTLIAELGRLLGGWQRLTRQQSS